MKNTKRSLDSNISKTKYNMKNRNGYNKVMNLKMTYN